MKKKAIPVAMTAGRAILGPVLIAGQACGWNGLALAGIVVTALLSDIFDGVLARRWKCDTAAVRLFDSMADMAFYLCVAAALRLGQPGFWKSHAALAFGLSGIEVARFGLEFWKYGKPASYHSYLAKTWGLVLAVAVVQVVAMGHAGLLFSVALWLGIVSNAEGLAMTLVLPVWRKDLKTFWAAWRLRRELARGKRPLKVLAGVLGAATILLVCMPGGSAQGTAGHLNTRMAAFREFRVQSFSGESFAA